MQLHEKQMREVYGETLVKLGEADPRIVIAEADLMKSNGTTVFANRFPERAFELGVAEANMVGVSAGLANVGLIPFCSSFAPFASRRVFDQAALSVAYANLNVTIVGTDPGVTAEANGGTHMSFEDLALYRLVPRMSVVAPCDAYELRAIVRWAVANEGPLYLQLLRKTHPAVFDETYVYEHGKGRLLREGKDVTIVSTGLMTHLARDAIRTLVEQGADVRHIHLPCIKPLDEEMLVAAARETGAVVTCENGFVAGGLGGAVAEVLAEQCPTPLKRIGVRDEFGEVATAEYLLDKHRMTAPHIAEAASELIRRKKDIQKAKGA